MFKQLRVDHRLLHYQTLTNWCPPALSGIVIIADGISQDFFRKSLFRRIAPPHMHIAFYEPSDYGKIQAKQEDVAEYLLLSDSIRSMNKALVSLSTHTGLEISIGALPKEEDATRVYEAIYLKPSDQEMIHQWHRLGCHVYAQHETSDGVQYTGCEVTPWENIIAPNKSK